MATSVKAVAKGTQVEVEPAVTIEKLLSDLLPTISKIHGGCMSCLQHFAAGANPVLADNGVRWRFEAHPGAGDDAIKLGLGFITLEWVPSPELQKQFAAGKISTANIEAAHLAEKGEQPVAVDVEAEPSKKTFFIEPDSPALQVSDAQVAALAGKLKVAAKDPVAEKPADKS